MPSVPSVQQQQFNILVSNDDGISALGIRVLANTLAAAGHRVTVVCPDRERSATGHGLTLHRPIHTEMVEGIFSPEVVAWSCSGTPSDCVKFGLSAVIAEKPDFVLSGINHGSNLGTDVLYSGTVSAAMEGLLEGIPSIAFSLSSASHNFQPAADFACRLLQRLPRQAIAPAVLLNVNVPDLPSDQIKGAKITRQGLRRYIEQFQKRHDPRGKVYYWLAGEVIEELPQPDVCNSNVPESIPSDVEAIAEGFITITPLQYIMNDVQTIQALSQTAWLS
ncbi:5'/3'-nucleotidase SurE [[Limnothrix rosea] IAM M-220]|uniref:5'/3'-nucleotidase SurE n=1 Tax=[Limnothrix rosea] IAM M-220 TaxID=454133 RepID=UPI0009605539|nr:5'/3'-nucleotidase SurE [[Limnothrix rosea] IAM M-220]OKH19400.1 5'/3'-nucleotidase SurE [[Limnothrix rosea] IAM M-220]